MEIIFFRTRFDYLAVLVVLVSQFPGDESVPGKRHLVSGVWRKSLERTNLESELPSIRSYFAVAYSAQ